MKKVMIVPGDGVGPEVVSATHKVLTVLTKDIEFIRFDAGLRYYKEQGYSMSRALLEAAKDCDAILLGTITDSNERGYVNPEYELIRFLGLTARVHRIASVVPDIAIDDIDTYIITPNEISNPITEMEDVDGITRNVRMQYRNSKTVFDTASEIGEHLGLKEITCVNYSDLYKMTGERYRDGFYESLKKKGFTLSDMTVEQFMPTMIKKNKKFEIITTPLVYSHLISSALVTVAGGLNITAVEDYDRDSAVFKPAHGPMQEIAGTDKVNPIGSLMSGAMMLKHFGMFAEAKTLEAAIRSASRNGYLTEDMGGHMSRTELMEKIVSYCTEHGVS